LPTPPLPDVIVITLLSMLYSRVQICSEFYVEERLASGTICHLVYHELLYINSYILKRINIRPSVEDSFHFFSSIQGNRSDCHSTSLTFNDQRRGERPLTQVSTTIWPCRIIATSGRGCASKPSGGRESKWAMRN